MKLAVIPARGGSKRIPRKNVKSFCGKPIIAWSIATAHSSGCFDRVIVSTDDAEIARVARHAGAEVPFIRPSELSDDHTGTIPVIRHAVEWQVATGESPTAVCCIYATAPFLMPEDIRRGLDLLDQKDADFAFSVAKYASPIQRAFRATASGHVEMFNPEQFQTRSQDLEGAFYDAAQFYWGKASAWCSAETLFTSSSLAVLLPSYRVQDIDTPDDWARAECMFKAQQEMT